MSRSEEELKTEIVSKLSQDRHVDASRISVNVKGGIVELTGVVTSDKERRVSGDIVKDIPSVAECRNHIIVEDKPTDDPLSHVA